MTRPLERRVARLERDTHVGPDFERANAILYACHMVEHHPEQATDEDRALAAATSREERLEAFWASVEYVGGLAEAVRLSYEGKISRATPIASPSPIAG